MIFGKYSNSMQDLVLTYHNEELTVVRYLDSETVIKVRNFYKYRNTEFIHVNLD